MLAIFGNGSTHRLARISAQLVNTVKRPNGELIKDLLLPTPPRTWGRRTGGQLKKWATTIKVDPETLLRTVSLRLRTMEKGLGDRL